MTMKILFSRYNKGSIFRMKVTVLLFGASIILSGCNSNEKIEEKDNYYKSEHLSRYGKYDTRHDLRVEPKSKQDVLSREALIKMAKQEGYLQGTKEALERSEGTIMGDFPYRNWNDPIMQTVEMPAMVVGGTLIPAHVENVIITPGGWKKNFGYPIQVSHPNYRVQGQPLEKKLPRFRDWKSNYENSSVRPVRSNFKEDIEYDETRGSKNEYSERTLNKDLNKRMPGTNFDPTKHSRVIKKKRRVIDYSMQKTKTKNDVKSDKTNDLEAKINFDLKSLEDKVKKNNNKKVIDRNEVPTWEEK